MHNISGCGTQKPTNHQGLYQESIKSHKVHIFSIRHTMGQVGRQRKYPKKIIVEQSKNKEKKGANKGVANQETIEIGRPQPKRIGNDMPNKNNCSSTIFTIKSIKLLIFSFNIWLIE